MALLISQKIYRYESNSLIHFAMMRNSEFIMRELVFAVTKYTIFRVIFLT